MAKPGRKPAPDIRIAKSWSGSNRPTPCNGFLEQQRREQIRQLAERLAQVRAVLQRK